MKVHLETIDLIESIRLSINSAPLEEIDWYKDGEKLLIDPDRIDNFGYTGLSNIDFIRSGYYEKETK